MPPDASQLEEHRPTILAHCYRMLGSVVDADDAVQETMVRAWRSIDRFEGRSSLRTWLHRIATRVCLDALAARKRRARPMEEGPAGTIDDPLIAYDRTHWLEPIPDALVLSPHADPAERAMVQQSIRLAFVAALQRLPPKQRAVLLLVEVLGCSAAETAQCLETSVPSVNSALQRARATMANPPPIEHEPIGDVQQDLLARYVDAFERYDVEALTALLREDATFSMPPYALWLQGPEAVAGWLTGRGAGCRGSKLVPTAACGLPAFGQYKPADDGLVPWGLVVLELDGDRIRGWNTFLDTQTLFGRFGLPPRLDR